MRRKISSSVSFSPGAVTGGFGRAGRREGCCRLGFDSCAKFFERSLSYQLAAMNDGHVAAEAFDDFQHVRSEKDRGAASDHALQHGFQRVRSDRVHAFERLVEKKDFGAVNYSGGQGEFLLHAVGIVGHERLSAGRPTA